MLTYRKCEEACRTNDLIHIATCDIKPAIILHARSQFPDHIAKAVWGAPVSLREVDRAEGAAYHLNIPIGATTVHRGVSGEHTSVIRTAAALVLRTCGSAWS